MPEQKKRHQVIHESEYTGPNNFHISVHGRELHVGLTYPPRDAKDEAEKPDQVRYVMVDQESVRASDGIRVWYDYERDGFVIEQGSTFEWNSDEEATADNAEDWQEVAFVKSWARDRDMEAEELAEADEGPVKAMRLDFHGEELVASFGFNKVPDGEHKVRTTVIRPGYPPYDFEWPILIKDGTMTALDTIVPSPPSQGEQKQ